MIVVAIAVVVVPPNIGPHSWIVVVFHSVDSANRLVRAATIVGLELADSNLGVDGLMPAGLAIDVENQCLYTLT